MGRVKRTNKNKEKSGRKAENKNQADRDQKEKEFEEKGDEASVVQGKDNVEKELDGIADIVEQEEVNDENVAPADGKDESEKTENTNQVPPEDTDPLTSRINVGSDKQVLLDNETVPPPENEIPGETITTLGASNDEGKEDQSVPPFREKRRRGC